MDRQRIQHILDKITEYFFQKMDTKDDLRGTRNTGSSKYKSKIRRLNRIQNQLKTLVQQVLEIKKHLQLRRIYILEEMKNIQMAPYDELTNMTLFSLEEEQSDILSLIELIDSYDLDDFIHIQCFDNICGICRGELDELVAHLPCSHCFHTKCMNAFLRTYNFKCPICRQKFDPIDIDFSDKVQYLNR